MGWSDILMLTGGNLAINPIYCSVKENSGMKRIWAACCAVGVGAFVFTASSVISSQNENVLTVDAQKELVNQYCAGCHNDKLRSGGFSWTSVDLAHPEQSAPQVERVIRKVRA